MSRPIKFRVGESVQHKSRKLYEATFRGWSKAGLRIGVRHNCLAPWGVRFVVDWYSPENIERYSSPHLLGDDKQ